MTSRDLQGTLLDGRYYVGAVLRETDGTTVFEATDTRVGTRLEIEVLAAEIDAWSPAARSLELRAALAAEVQHPAVVAPHDVGLLDDGSPYVVRPRRSGITLDDRVCLGGPLPMNEVVRIGLDLLSVLATAHEKGIRHGSIAPEHVIIIERDGVLLGVQLDDFGIEAPKNDDHRTLGFSRLAFVAPERLDAATTAAAVPTVASDIFALAAVLHFASTGQSPETVRRGAGAFGALPARISRALRRAMHPEPPHRYASAQEMLTMFFTLRDAPAVDRDRDDILPPTRPAYESGRFVLEERTMTATSTCVGRVSEPAIAAKAS